MRLISKRRKKEAIIKKDINTMTNKELSGKVKDVRLISKRRTKETIIKMNISTMTNKELTRI